MQIFSYAATFVFIMCVLNLIREAIHLVKCFMTMEEYKLATNAMVLLMASLSYVITFLINAH